MPARSVIHARHARKTETTLCLLRLPLPVISISLTEESAAVKESATLMWSFLLCVNTLLIFSEKGPARDNIIARLSGSPPGLALFEAENRSSEAREAPSAPDMNAPAVTAAIHLNDLSTRVLLPEVNPMNKTNTGAVTRRRIRKVPFRELLKSPAMRNMT